MSAASRCSPLADAHASQLQAALGYCARRLLADLERDGAASPLARRLTPTSAALLRWWFAGTIARTRVDNFHPGHREAIVHVVLAHEVFGTSDAERLFRLACTPEATTQPPGPEPRDRRLVLCSAPGVGRRWVLQALLVWQWANHMAARAAGREDPRFSDRFTLLVPTAARRHWEDTLLGPVAVAGLRTAGDAGILRRARLFLPPALRAPFRFWLMLQACTHDALRVLADDTQAGTVSLVAGRGPRLASGLPAPSFSGSGAIPLQAPPSLRVTWADGDAPQAPCDGPCVSEFGPARAIRYGVAKLPVLQCAPKRHALREGEARRPGARPALRRDHTAQLRLGLRALAHRESAFATLDPARTPRMRVLCDTPALQRAARARLLELGVPADEVALEYPPDAVTGDGRPRIGIAALWPAPPADPRVCVLVVLRNALPDADEAAGGMAAALAAGAPALWPQPELARLRAANRERAAFGQPPDTLFDVLTVVEHRDVLPLYAPWRRLGLASVDPRPPEAVPPIGDVVVATACVDAARYEIALPPTCADIAALDTPERLADLPHRLLRASRALPVRKSIYPLAGWHEDDSGLRRGFIEAAEHDPCIESHCLLDPHRHASRHRDTLLALGMDGRGRVDALAKTAAHVFLIEFLPACPPDRPGGGASRHDGGERALRLWRRRTNTLPPEQRDHRLWRRVRLQAPLFWSCKRHGVPLSALLEALASTRSLVVAGPAHAPVAGGVAR
ncbi:MAG: hypothetical protein KF800_15545 [Lysobacter sp.]|nr:hypothetical protein [Lysobacter sp.]